MTFLGNAALSSGAIALASLGVAPVYGAEVIGPAAALAVVSATVVVGLAVRLGGSALGVAVATAVVLVGGGTVLASPAELGGGAGAVGAVGRTLAALVLGWKELLTLDPPVGAFGDLVVPGFAVLLVAATAGLWTACRGRRPALAIAAPFGAVVFGIAFGPSSTPDAFGTGSALFVMSVAWLRWILVTRGPRAADEASTAERSATSARSSAGEPHGAALRRRGVAVALVAAAAAAGPIVADVAHPVLPRATLRDVVSPTLEPDALRGPLAAYRRSFDPARIDAVELTVAADAPVDRIRVASLGAYDGVVATIAQDSAAFRRVAVSTGRTPVRGAWRSGDVVTASIVAADYSGVWVPFAGRPRTLGRSGSGAVYVDGVTGTAVVAGGLAPGNLIDSTADVLPTVTLAELADCSPGRAAPFGGAAPAASRSGSSSTGPVSSAVVATLAGTPGAGTPGERLASALAAVIERGHLSHGGPGEAPSRSGHSIERIDELLESEAPVGDDEQFSVAGALLAARIGFPVRIGVGYRVASGAAGADGAVEVRGRDAAAWLEIDTAERGWIVVDVTPARTDPPVEAPTVPAPVERPQAIVLPPQPDTLDRRSGSSEQREGASPPSPPVDPPADPAPVIVLVVLGVVGAPVAVVLLAKRVRSSVRRRGGPRRRIRGAWREYLDAATDAGLPVSAAAASAATRIDLAAVTADPRARVLARVADRAAFAPEEPSDDDARAVWAALPALIRDLHRRRSGGRFAALRRVLSSLRARISPVSLFGAVRRTSASRRDSDYSS